MSVGSFHSSNLIWDVEQDCHLFGGEETEAQRRKTPSCPKHTDFATDEISPCFLSPFPLLPVSSCFDIRLDLIMTFTGHVRIRICLTRWLWILNEVKESCASPQLSVFPEEIISEHQCVTLPPQAGWPPGNWSWSLCLFISPRLQVQLPYQCRNSRSVSSFMTQEGTSSTLWSAEDHSQDHRHFFWRKTVIYFDKSTPHPFPPHSPF